MLFNRKSEGGYLDPAMSSDATHFARGLPHIRPQSNMLKHGVARDQIEASVMPLPEIPCITDLRTISSALLRGDTAAVAIGFLQIQKGNLAFVAIRNGLPKNV